MDTMGCPLSAATTVAGSSGIAPRKFNPSCLARASPPPVVAADVPPECLPVWVKRGSPIVVVDDDRAGGVVIRNRGVFGDDLVRGLIDDYVAVVSALVTDPGTTPERVRLPDGACFLDHAIG